MGGARKWSSVVRKVGGIEAGVGDPEALSDNLRQVPGHTHRFAVPPSPKHRGCFSTAAFGGFSEGRASRRGFAEIVNLTDKEVRMKLQSHLESASWPESGRSHVESPIARSGDKLFHVAQWLGPKNSRRYVLRTVSSYSLPRARARC